MAGDERRKASGAASAPEASGKRPGGSTPRSGRHCAQERISHTLATLLSGVLSVSGRVNDGSMNDPSTISMRTGVLGARSLGCHIQSRNVLTVLSGVNPASALTPGLRAADTCVTAWSNDCVFE